MSRINLLTHILFTILPFSYSSPAGRLRLHWCFLQSIYQIAAHVSQIGSEQSVAENVFKRSVILEKISMYCKRDG